MKIKRFQEGGQAAPAPAQGGPAGGQEGAPAPAGQGGSPEEQLAQMAVQIVQQLGPEAAGVLAQMIMELLKQAGGGGAPQGAPTYARQGGKLTLIGRK
jgi:hypothetical protein